MISRERRASEAIARDEIETGFGVAFWRESMIARYLLDPKEWEGLREDPPVRFRDATRREDEEGNPSSLNNIIYSDAPEEEKLIEGIDRRTNVHYIEVNK
jgi:hypothetical protein